MQMNDISVEFLKTRDGSQTIYLKHLDETYHSINGAFSESLHVYILNGLKRINPELNEITIMEIGFGTGLNALLTLDYLLPHQKVNYIAFEPFPLSYEILKSYYEGFPHLPQNIGLIKALSESSYNQWNAITPQFNFCILKTDLQNQDVLLANLINKGDVDLMYYDAFAPAKQAEMWTEDTIRCAVDYLKVGGLLTTYCAQGQFKRNLKNLNMKVESVVGPIGKREMTIAYKEATHNETLL
jgi:tRNA U34 5-methylaminomethyl-2-thiouridine-forming methyltransferase MnmC